MREFKCTYCPVLFGRNDHRIRHEKATHSKIRFAVHDNEETHSYKEAFEIGGGFNKGMKIILEDNVARIIGLTLHGGKSVNNAFAFEIARVTCRYVKEESRFKSRYKDGRKA